MSDVPSDADIPQAKRKRGSNQHLPTPPPELLDPYIVYYWKLGFHDAGIARQCLDHFDIQEYGLSPSTVKRRRKALGLKGTRKQAVTWEIVFPLYSVYRAKFPNMGARTMVSALRQDYGIKVPEALLLKAFKQYEPEGVARRKRRRFRRKRFWSAGVMDILAFDQHDKWKRFGLWLHACVDPFSGRIAWLNVWWTNRNPKLITGYYIKSGRQVGGIPLVTQSDPGSENYGIANCHTVTRQRLDPLLIGTLQHRWMNKLKAMNVKPEVLWSLLHRNFAPGFEDVLEEGIRNNLYNVNDPLHQLVFRWIVIPWLQKELDAWVVLRNSTPRRSDKHKILPQGIPDLIASKPEQYGTKDYKVLVSPEMFDEMEETWAPRDDPVFKLTPDNFDRQALALYDALGSPPVGLDTIWIVYADLLNAFLASGDHSFEDELTAADNHFEVPMELLPGQQDLPDGNWAYEYLGGLAVPPPEEEEEEDEEDAVDPRVYALFSDEEDDEENDDDEE
ncbi:hypothetical protein C8F04DRAFT_1138129 [Mycena alexandri]|uniref:Integrase core domain-containing protein n=1 Tax=Mycena alexandri TaxID=1745969 RepID=A0AAD6WSZ9_9AGAR|nr:hypothetical protein C8F04DRAFT_1138129 [Mycena alexandri]